MVSEYMEGIRNTMSKFSETVEEQLLFIEKNHITDKEQLSSVFGLWLSRFFVIDEKRTDNMKTSELLTEENLEAVTCNAEICRERQYAAGFNRIHIEPVLAMAEIFRKAGLDSEAYSIMKAYDFALGMRRLYSKLAWQ